MKALSTTVPPSGRLGQIDLLKALASQLIVLHHLAFYGPMSDLAATLWPQVFEFLARHARLAVQVFLVIGGFLAARGLAGAGRLAEGAKPLALLRDRYLRLVLPYAAVLVLAVAAAALARAWMDHDSVPAAPTAGQLLAHLLLLQDLAGIDALSAGVWYVAIDFQLFALLLALLLVARRLGRGDSAVWAPLLVLALTGGSLLQLNRIAGLDAWAPYFFGAYGMGVLAAWQAGWTRGRRLLIGAATLVLLAAALAIEFRSRIALAAAVALVLARWGGAGPALFGRAEGLVSSLSRISYAVFLVHFPVCLLVNAAFVRFVPPEPALQLAGVGLAWLLSVAAGAALHHGVERPSLRALRRWPAEGSLARLRTVFNV